VGGVGDGISALEAVRRAPPDLVLLDLALPDIRGEIVFVRLHALFPELSVVVVTASSDETLGRRLPRLGAFDYVPKSVNFELLERIGNVGLRCSAAGGATPQTEGRWGAAADIKEGSLALHGADKDIRDADGTRETGWTSTRRCAVPSRWTRWFRCCWIGGSPNGAGVTTGQSSSDAASIAAADCMWMPNSDRAAGHS
jgi:CheY-like chemotaxis protein